MELQELYQWIELQPEMIEKLDSGTLRKFLEECLK